MTRQGGEGLWRRHGGVPRTAVRRNHACTGAFIQKGPRGESPASQLPFLPYGITPNNSVHIVNCLSRVTSLSRASKSVDQRIPLSTVDGRYRAAAFLQKRGNCFR